MAIKKLSCPICGAKISAEKVTWVWYLPSSVYIECPECGARTEERTTENEAIKAWLNGLVIPAEIRLKPCPVCHAKFSYAQGIWELSNKKFYIMCPECESMTDDLDTPELAVEAWNNQVIELPDGTWYKNKNAE